MASVSASDFKNVMNITTSSEHVEYVLDLAIDALNIFGATLSNMSGAAGSKTVSLTSSQRGGVFMVAREVYEKFYKDSGSSSVAGMSVTVSDILNDADILDLLERIGEKLGASTEGIPFKVVEDQTGYE